MPKRPADVATLLIDFDGTLANSLGAMRDAYRCFAREVGFEPSDSEFDTFNGPPLPIIVRDLAQRHGLDIDLGDALDLYHRHVADQTRAIRPNWGARQMLRTAADRGWRVGIVTSNARGAVESFLDRWDLSACISDIVSGDTVPGKPDPTPYLTALRRLNADSGTSLALEDSAQGLAASSSAGLYSIAFTPIDRSTPPGSNERIESLTRIFDRAEGASLRLRLARPTDMPFLYGIRNRLEDVHLFATPRQLTDTELYQRFEPDPTLAERIILILEDASGPAAMTRFDRDRNDGFQVSIGVAAARRGSGLGRIALLWSIDAVCTVAAPVRLKAQVDRANTASMRLFDGCGFHRRETADRLVHWEFAAE